MEGPREGLVIDTPGSDVLVLLADGSTTTCRREGDTRVVSLFDFLPGFARELPRAAKLFFAATDPWAVEAGYGLDLLEPWIREATSESRESQRALYFHAARRRDPKWAAGTDTFCDLLQEHERSYLRALARSMSGDVVGAINALQQLPADKYPEKLDIVIRFVPELLTDRHRQQRLPVLALLEAETSTLAANLCQLLKIDSADRKQLQEVADWFARDFDLEDLTAGRISKSIRAGGYSQMYAASDLLHYGELALRYADPALANVPDDPELSDAVLRLSKWPAVDNALTLLPGIGAGLEILTSLEDMSLTGIPLPILDDIIDTGSDEHLRDSGRADLATRIRAEVPEKSAYLIGRLFPEQLTNAEVDVLGFSHERLRRDIEAGRATEESLPEPMRSRIRRRRALVEAANDAIPASQLDPADRQLLLELRAFTSGGSGLPSEALCGEAGLWPLLAKGVGIDVLVEEMPTLTGARADFAAWVALRIARDAVLAGDWDNAKQTARICLACTTSPMIVAEAKNLLAYMAWTGGQPADAAVLLEQALSALGKPCEELAHNLDFVSDDRVGPTRTRSISENFTVSTQEFRAGASLQSSGLSWTEDDSDEDEWEPIDFSPMDISESDDEFESVGPISEYNGDGIDVLSMIWITQAAQMQPNSFGAGQVHWYRGDVFSDDDSLPLPAGFASLLDIWSEQLLAQNVPVGHGLQGFFSTPMNRPVPLYLSYSAEDGGKLRIFTSIARQVPDGLEKSAARRSVVQWSLRKVESAVHTYWGYRSESEDGDTVVARMTREASAGLGRQGWLSNPANLNETMILSTFSDITRFPGPGGARFASFLPYAMYDDVKMLPTFGSDQMVPPRPNCGTVFAGWQYDVPVGTDPSALGINWNWAIYGGVALAALADLMVVNRQVLRELGGEPFAAW